MEETINILRDPNRAIVMPIRQRKIIALIAELYKLSDDYRALSSELWAYNEERDKEFWEALCGARQILIEDLNDLQLEDLIDKDFKEYANRG